MYRRKASAAGSHPAGHSPNGSWLCCVTSTSQEQSDILARPLDVCGDESQRLHAELRKYLSRIILDVLLIDDFLVSRGD